MRTTLLIAAAALFAAPALAQAPAPAPAGTYVADKPHTSVTWKALHNGLAWYTARFTDVTITVDFNEADVTKSKVNATIEAKSIETDYARTKGAKDEDVDFNKDVATNERFLNAGKYPTITFVSTAITKTGTNTGKMTGNLTLFGVTKPVTLDVTYIGHRNDPRLQKHKIGFQAVGSIKRSDFNAPALGFLADETKVEINSEMIQK